MSHADFDAFSDFDQLPDNAGSTNTIVKQPTKNELGLTKSRGKKLASQKTPTETTSEYSMAWFSHHFKESIYYGKVFFSIIAIARISSWLIPIGVENIKKLTE